MNIERNYFEDNNSGLKGISHSNILVFLRLSEVVYYGI